MSVKSEMAAMMYLSKMKPKKYMLDEYMGKYTLSMVKYHLIEGFPMWGVIHKVYLGMSK